MSFKNTTTLLESQKWWGEFFQPDSYSKRFTGEIDYSPEDGVILSYLIAHQEHMNVSTALHGVLSTGEKCTLVGSFQTRNSGWTVSKGLHSKNGKTAFNFLAVGNHITPNDKVAEIEFSLSNLQEFFQPGPGNNKAKFSEKPFCEISTDLGKISIETPATFTFIEGGISNYLYNRNLEALEELEKVFSELCDKYDDSRFMVQKNISYTIRIKFETPCTCSDALAEINKIADLFALLTFKPTYPENIKAFIGCAATPHNDVSIYPSMIINPNVVKVAKRKVSYLQMPVTHEKVDLNKLISNWLKIQEDFLVIISSVQNDTEIFNKHDAYGDIMLYATQFDSISHAAGKYKIKYEYPLDQYAHYIIIDELYKSFGTRSLQTLGREIGYLRDDIAHIGGRKKKWVDRLSLEQLLRVSRSLQLVIISHILEEIGVSKDSTLDYQFLNSIGD